MNFDLADAARKVGEIFTKKSNAFRKTRRNLNIVIAACALVIALAHTEPIPEMTGWDLIGLIAVVVVFFSSLVLVGTETDSGNELEFARAALAAAQEQQTITQVQARKFNEIEAVYESELERMSHLQAGRDLIRTIIEGVASSPTVQDEITVITRLLNQAQRALLIAHGFQLNEHYTICIYRAERDASSQRVTLRCAAHLRAIMCDVAVARPWPEGIGVAGMAYARNAEIVVPDLTAPELGTLYELPEKRTDDDNKYRSIVGEPIVPEGGELWGVLTATSSEPGHFSLDDRRYVDVAQSLAGMIALAISVNRAKKSEPARPAPQN